MNTAARNGATSRGWAPGPAERSGPVTYFIGASVRRARRDVPRGQGVRRAIHLHAMEESDLSWRLLDADWSILVLR